ncbi:hypothetical protein ACWCPX_06880 [Streptomyces olivaceoviridis]
MSRPHPRRRPAQLRRLIEREGHSVFFSSVGRRQKVRDLRRDPRISRSVFDLANPCHSAEIRGVAEICRTRTSGSRTFSP